MFIFIFKFSIIKSNLWLSFAKIPPTLAAAFITTLGLTFSINVLVSS